jgi:hypothetical protein
MRKGLALVLVLVFLIGSSIIVHLTVKAASRTIIVPDDYPTITAAIANAVVGDTIFAKKGIYEGPQNQTLFINKTISLIGEDPQTTTINLHPPLVQMNIFTYQYMGYLDAIRIDADWVKLSGFTITSDGGDLSAVGNGTQIIDNNLSFGVTATGDGTQIVRNTLTWIALSGSCQTIAQNTILGWKNEFLISCTGSYNTINSNRVAGSTGGIYTNGSHNIIHENSITAYSGINAGVELNGNENILYLNSISNFVHIGSSRFPQSSSNIICRNTITNNIAIIGNDNTFSANYIQGVVIGNSFQGASNNVFYHNNFDFFENQAWPVGGKTFTVWVGVKGAIFLDNGNEGNYYSDYNGSDLNFDGVGDTPYIIVTKDNHNYHFTADFNIADLILTDNYPLITPFDISSVTIELPKWEYNPPPQSPIPTPKLTPSPIVSATPPIPSQVSASNQDTQFFEPFPLTIAATAIAVSITLIGIGLMIYFKKHKRAAVFPSS